MLGQCLLEERVHDVLVLWACHAHADVLATERHRGMQAHAAAPDLALFCQGCVCACACVCVFVCARARMRACECVRVTRVCARLCVFRIITRDSCASIFATLGPRTSFEKRSTWARSACARRNRRQCTPRMHAQRGLRRPPSRSARRGHARRNRRQCTPRMHAKWGLRITAPHLLVVAEHGDRRARVRESARKGSPLHARQQRCARPYGRGSTQRRHRRNLCGACSGVGCWRAAEARGLAPHKHADPTLHGTKLRSRNATSDFALMFVGLVRGSREKKHAASTAIRSRMLARLFATDQTVRSSPPGAAASRASGWQARGAGGACVAAARAPGAACLRC